MVTEARSAYSSEELWQGIVKQGGGLTGAGSTGQSEPKPPAEAIADPEDLTTPAATAHPEVAQDVDEVDQPASLAATVPSLIGAPSSEAVPGLLPGPVQGLSTEMTVMAQAVSATATSPPAEPVVAGVAQLVIAPRHKPPKPPGCLPERAALFLGLDGRAYIRLPGSANARALRVGSREANVIITTEAASRQLKLRSADLKEVNEALQAWAERYGEKCAVWYRVASIPGGVEIDVGDDNDTRVRITAGVVETIRAGSDTLFYRTQHTRAMALPAEVGNLGLLKKYVNLHPKDYLLFIGWLTYTLAHPKVQGTTYPILVLQGGQGTGKTSLCKNIILTLLDPSVIGVRLMPANNKDLAIAVQSAHVVCFDNVRGFKSSLSDLFCIVATGGQTTARQLYTDEEQHVMHLHGALVLNGIHSFVNQSDLAQRCLPLHLLPLPETKRQSEAAMIQALHVDLPAIQRGLLDLIAQVFKHLPTVKVTNPERAIDFVAWLAGMEAAHGVPSGVYQMEYSDLQQQGQLDSLLDSPLGAEVVAFVDTFSSGSWSGTPAKLYATLTDIVAPATARSRDWPPNPIALSKRLLGLQASLLTQGIQIEFTRGKQRTITITKVGGASCAL